MSNVRVVGRQKKNGTQKPSSPAAHLLPLSSLPPSQLNRKSEMKYCDACNTWIKNHPAAIAMHEQGANHKANVAKRE